MKNKNKFDNRVTPSTNRQNIENTTKEAAFVESAIKSSTKTIQHTVSDSLAFGKKNYTIMLVGLATIIIGFFIMTLDKEDFGFGFMGLTLGPIIAFIGFLIEFYAILKK